MTEFERQEEQALLEDSQRFAKDLAKWSAKSLGKQDTIQVMRTPLVLEMLGIDKLPILIAPSKLTRIRKDHKGIDEDILKQLPRALANPMAVFLSATVQGRIVVALDLQDKNGIEVVVPMVLNVRQKWKSGKAHVIASIYGKGDENRKIKHANFGWYLNHFKEGRCVYAHKAKVARFFRSAGVQFSLEKETSNLVDYSIKTEADLVKFKMDKAKKWKEETQMTEDRTMQEGAAAYADVPPPMDMDLPPDYSDSYHQEYEDVYESTRESFTPAQSEEIRQGTDRLHETMKDFEKTEARCGPDQDAWDKFAPMHEANVKNILLASDISEAAGKESEAAKTAVSEAVQSISASDAFLRARERELLEKQKEYEAQMEAMRQRIAQLEEARQFEVGSSDDFIRAIRVAADFLKQIEDMRKDGANQPRKVASELFRESRHQAKEAYYALKLAPTQIKAYIAEQRDKAVDGVLGKVAGFFESGIEKLRKVKEDILAKTSANRSAADFYRTAFPEEATKTEDGSLSINTDKRIALRMAKAGYGAYAIRITLERVSPLRELYKKDGTGEEYAKKATEMVAEEARKGGQEAAQEEGKGR